MLSFVKYYLYYEVNKVSKHYNISSVITGAGAGWAGLGLKDYEKSYIWSVFKNDDIYYRIVQK